jgi:hypothetical protein
MRTNLIKLTERKHKNGRWCEIEIVLTAHQDATSDNVIVARDAFEAGEFSRIDALLGAPCGVSICGSEGHVLTPAATKRAALQTWVNYFEENPAEIITMGQRFNRQFRTARGAAKFVIESDGDYHGVDVHATEGKLVFVTESCGQIRETIAEWFPEFAGLLQYHLSDMRAGAPDQESALRDFEAPPYPANHYESACAHLESLGLLYSKSEDTIHVTGRGVGPACSFWKLPDGTTRGYKYGEGWVATSLPRAAYEALHALWTADQARRTVAA